MKIPYNGYQVIDIQPILEQDDSLKLSFRVLDVSEDDVVIGGNQNQVYFYNFQADKLNNQKDLAHKKRGAFAPLFI